MFATINAFGWSFTEILHTHTYQKKRGRGQTHLGLFAKTLLISLVWLCETTAILCVLLKDKLHASNLLAKSQAVFKVL